MKTNLLKTGRSYKYIRGGGKQTIKYLGMDGGKYKFAPIMADDKQFGLAGRLTEYDVSKYVRENKDGTQRINPTRAIRVEDYYPQIRYTYETRSRNFDWLGKPSQGKDDKKQLYHRPFRCSDFTTSPKRQQNNNHELANCKFLIEYAQRLISELSRACQHPNTISEQRRQNLYRASLRFQLDTESLLDLDNLEKDVRHVGVVGCSNPFDKQHTKLNDSF